jgi:hypothetical protein
MQVRWSLKAADDLETIVRYIQQDDPEAARRVARTTYTAFFPTLWKSSASSTAHNAGRKRNRGTDPARQPADFRNAADSTELSVLNNLAIQTIRQDRNARCQLCLYVAGS